LWTLGEWSRSGLFTGFPWSNIGYSHLPHTFLAGFAPILGVYGISFLVLLSVALLAFGWHLSRRYLWLSLLALSLLWGMGYALQSVSWTKPHGKPLSVSLIQGNVPQATKWQPDRAAQIISRYLGLVQQSQGALIILPETALPVFLHHLPSTLVAQFQQFAASRALVVGIPTVNMATAQYYNSAVLFTDKALPVYHKYHLVPFGEYVPWPELLHWFLATLHIPLTDFSAGAKKQPPFLIQDQKIAVNICYEDIFGEEIIRALPQATILANISNLAWFEQSIALAQHGQMAQARALETGRPMLRATNTGLTAIIDHHGQLLKRAPIGQETILTGMVQGRQGMTPYARMGNLGILSLLVILALGGLSYTRARSKSCAD
jgi:apolipoprotein N-acyltransferase